MNRFAGQTALITGATGNLGRATAFCLASQGVQIVLTGKDAMALEALSKSLPGNHLISTFDLLDSAAFGNCVKHAEARFGSIDILIATAGGFDMGPTAYDADLEIWQKMQALNLETLLASLAAIVPGMKQRRQGKIVTVGASAALKGGAGMAAYAAFKSAVMRVTESASAELKNFDINVNAVLPSVLDTPENRSAMPNADTGKWVSLDQLASVIAFLASSESDAVHGALIPVTGRS